MKWTLLCFVVLTFVGNSTVSAEDTTNSKVGITFYQGTDNGEANGTTDNKITDNKNGNSQQQFPQTSESLELQQLSYTGMVFLIGSFLLYKKNRERRKCNEKNGNYRIG